MAQEYPPSLSAEGRRLLELRLSGRPGRKSSAAREEKKPDRIPISLVQRRLWFISQMAPDILAYNVDAAYRIRGPLDHDALGAAVQDMVRRHEALRTRFEMVDGEPFQVVARQAEKVLALHDMSSEPDPIGSTVTLAARVADTPYSLTDDPLFRAWLARLGERDHVFGIGAHHLIFDHESLAILVDELGQAYAEREQGRAPELGEIPAQYTDFALWQIRRSEANGFAAHRRYWRERLMSAPVFLELPADRSRPAQPSYRAGEVAVSLPAEAVACLGRLARERGTTLFTVALAGFQGLLARYRGAEEPVVVGCGFNGRSRLEFEGVLGFFANSLPILVDLSANPPFTAMVDATREAMLEAHEHQDLPFEEIVVELAPPRDLSHNPVFQVWFDLTGSAGGAAAGPGLLLPGCQVEPFPTGCARTRFDLELHLVETAAGTLSGRLLYATDLFDSTTAQELVGHYQSLLTAVAHDPGLRLARIPILEPAELSRILDTWGAAS
ncbi:condensation domain-containing protein [Nocardia sp. NPDC060256]|uniref:condensation domain-containing protein n=1 Tax=unclassified Nocardia TaxID=2637762 RepID=UPI00364A7EC5